MYEACVAPVLVDDKVTEVLEPLPINSSVEGDAPVAVPNLHDTVVKLVAKSVFVTLRFNNASSSVLEYVVARLLFNNNEASTAVLL